MTDEMLKKYIESYKPKGKRNFQTCDIDGDEFTFMVEDNETVGVVFHMGKEPHIYVSEGHRGKNYGFRLLKGYLIGSGLVNINSYIFYNAGTKEGLALIKKLKKREPDTYKVIEVDINKFIILKDYRIKYAKI